MDNSAEYNSANRTKHSILYFFRSGTTPREGNMYKIKVYFDFYIRRIMRRLCCSLPPISFLLSDFNCWSLEERLLGQFSYFLQNSCCKNVKFILMCETCISVVKMWKDFFYDLHAVTGAQVDLFHLFSFRLRYIAIWKCLVGRLKSLIDSKIDFCWMLHFLCWAKQAFALDARSVLFVNI